MARWRRKLPRPVRPYRHAFKSPYSRSRARRRKNEDPRAFFLFLAIVAILWFASFCVQFSEKKPGQAALIGLVALSSVLGWGSLRLYKRARRRRKERDLLIAQECAARAITESDIDCMTGEQLERYLVRLFRYLGFEVEHVGGRGDQGADLILTKPSTGEKIACQSKRYAGKVDNKAVQQAHAAAGYYHCQKSLVVTNSEYTKSAQDLADHLHCELIGRRRLGMIVAAYREKGPETDRQRKVTRLLGLP